MFLWALFSRNGCFKCERSGNIYMIVLFFFALLVLDSGRPPPAAAAHRLRRGWAAVVLFCVAGAWFGRPPPMGAAFRLRRIDASRLCRIAVVGALLFLLQWRGFLVWASAPNGGGFAARCYGGAGLWSFGFRRPGPLESVAFRRETDVGKSKRLCVR